MEFFYILDALAITHDLYKKKRIRLYIYSYYEKINHEKNIYYLGKINDKIYTKYII